MFAVSGLPEVTLNFGRNSRSRCCQARFIGDTCYVGFCPNRVGWDFLVLRGTSKSCFYSVWELQSIMFFAASGSSRTLCLQRRQTSSCVVSRALQRAVCVFKHHHAKCLVLSRGLSVSSNHFTRSVWGSPEGFMITNHYQA